MNRLKSFLLFMISFLLISCNSDKIVLTKSQHLDLLLATYNVNHEKFTTIYKRNKDQILVTIYLSKHYKFDKKVIAEEQKLIEQFLSKEFYSYPEYSNYKLKFDLKNIPLKAEVILNKNQHAYGMINAKRITRPD